MARKVQVQSKQNYNLLIDLLDHGWLVKEFNSSEVTLVPDPDRKVEH